MMNVLYLHGLGSGGCTTTGQILKDVMKNYNVVTVDLYHDIKRSLDIIYEAVDLYEIDIIIGTSLGGFFTLATDFDGIKVAINPVLDPSKDLVQFIGTHQYFVPRKDGIQTYTMTQSDIDEYTNYELLFTNNTYVIESTHDELLGDNISKIKLLMKQIELETNDTHVFVTNKIGHRLTEEFVRGDLKYILNDIINDLSNDKNVLYSPDFSTSDIVLEKQEINEYQYVNLWTDNKEGFVHANDIDQKKKYCDEVWDLLQKAYDHIGGCKSFDDKEEMISKADLWKMKIRSGKISAVILYTIQKGGGRKLIAAGSRKSDNAIEAEQCKNDLVKMIKDDCVMTKRNTWAEVSGTMEYYFRKFGAAVIPVEKAKLILAKKSSQMVNIEDANDIDIANKQDIERIPNKKGEHYVRPIGGHMHRKVILGNYNDEKALETLQINIKNSVRRQLNEAMSLLNMDDDINFEVSDIEIASKTRIANSGVSMLNQVIEPYINKETREDPYDQAVALYNKYGYRYTIKNSRELAFLISRMVIAKKRWDADLNWMDVSQISVFSYLFQNTPFNGKIGHWNVSGGTTFAHMFAQASQFNGNLIGWDINPDADISGIFAGCPITNDHKPLRLQK